MLFKNSSSVTKAVFPGTGPDLHLTYLRNLLRYCLLHTDQENTPLFPVSVGDIIFPSAFLQAFPSPSWIIPKLKREPGGRVEIQIKQKQDKIWGKRNTFWVTALCLNFTGKVKFTPFVPKPKIYAPYKLILVWVKFQLTAIFVLTHFSDGKGWSGSKKSHAGAAQGASDRTMHRGCTGAADCAQSFPVSPFLTPKGELFHGEVDGHHGSYAQPHLSFPMNLPAQNLQECEPGSAQGQCLLTSILWRSESRAILPTGMHPTHHHCLPNQREELQSSICSKENGWEWTEYRSMNIKILLFF